MPIFLYNLHMENTRFIEKVGDDWKLSKTKGGRAIKKFDTQEQVLLYAGTMKSVDKVMIKRIAGPNKGKWTEMNSSDKAKIKRGKQFKKNSSSHNATANETKKNILSKLAPSKKKAAKKTTKKSK